MCNVESVARTDELMENYHPTLHFTSALWSFIFIFLTFKMAEHTSFTATPCEQLSRKIPMEQQE